MSLPRLDRHHVRYRPLAERANKVFIERDHVPVGTAPPELPPALLTRIADIAAAIRAARAAGRPVMLTFGAHTIKNGLGLVLIDLIERGHVTHLATNGAGIIHDWEFAFQGATSEDVRAGIAAGAFGHWHETGHHLNLALAAGAWAGLGYGESVGELIHADGLTLPTSNELRTAIAAAAMPTGEVATAERAAAAADLLALTLRETLPSGRIDIPHAWKRFSVQAAARRLGVPFTSHPMFGHDIIYNHPLNCGAAIGRCAERDFLAFAESVSRIEGGVYLSLGSAVMSPMVFEKSFSMAQSLALQRGAPITSHRIVVVDLAQSGWDWNDGEPPIDDPAYYLRYNKTFARMGGHMDYLSLDNRVFLLALAAALREEAGA